MLSGSPTQALEEPSELGSAPPSAALLGTALLDTLTAPQMLGASPRVRRRSTGDSGAVSEYLGRMTDWKQMDFEHAYSQMVYLCLDPKSVYRSTQLHYRIKGQWARDDPAFVAILLFFMTVTAVAYTATFGVGTDSSSIGVQMWDFIRIILGFVCFDLLGVGCIVATAYWWITNNYFRVRRLRSGDAGVEWMYAFDIHCNSFFPTFNLLYVLQFFLSPLLLQRGIIAAFLANTLYAAAMCYYTYITFLGYDILPFLHGTQSLLGSIGVIITVYLIATVLQFNASRLVLDLYFGK